MYKSFTDVLAAARKKGPVALAAACPHDQESLTALFEGSRKKLIKPILVGREKLINAFLSKSGFRSFTPEIINEEEDQTAALAAARLVREGRAGILMKGLINSSDFLKAVLDKDSGLKQGQLLSHMSALEIPGHRRLIFLTDGGLNVAPDLAAKKEILINALKALALLGWPKPKVAVLSHNEKVSPKMPSTWEAKSLVDMAGELPPCLIEGPMAMDVAADRKAAKHKGIDSQVAGRADLWLMPNIEAGNISSKALIYYAKAQSAGLVLGACRPIVLCSRSDSVKTKLYSMALGVLMNNTDASPLAA